MRSKPYNSEKKITLSPSHLIAFQLYISAHDTESHAASKGSEVYCPTIRRHRKRTTSPNQKSRIHYKDAEPSSQDT